MKPNQVIRFGFRTDIYYTYNIRLDSAGPVRANVICVHLVLQHVTYLVINNIQFIGCEGNTGPSIFLDHCAQVTLSNVAFIHETHGILANSINGEFTLDIAEFRYLRGSALVLYGVSETLQHIGIYNSVFEDNNPSYLGYPYQDQPPAFAIDIRFSVFAVTTDVFIEISGVSITNNTHTEASGGINITPDISLQHVPHFAVHVSIKM